VFDGNDVVQFHFSDPSAFAFVAVVFFQVKFNSVRLTVDDPVYIHCETGTVICSPSPPPALQRTPAAACTNLFGRPGKHQLQADTLRHLAPCESPDIYPGINFLRIKEQHTPLKGKGQNYFSEWQRIVYHLGGHKFSKTDNADST
jgi:hypothetical protein